VLEFLEAFKVAEPNIYQDRELLLSIARTSLRTKLSEEVSHFGGKKTGRKCLGLFDLYMCISFHFFLNTSLSPINA
jgi:hypothetical protein